MDDERRGESIQLKLAGWSSPRGDVSCSLPYARNHLPPCWAPVSAAAHCAAGAGAAYGVDSTFPTPRDDCRAIHVSALHSGFSMSPPCSPDKRPSAPGRRRTSSASDWMDGLHPHTLAELPVDIMAAELRRRQRKELRYQFTELQADDALVRDGIRITSPCRTAFDGARWADSLEDAVVFVDSVTKFLNLDLTEFRAYVAAHADWTGVEQGLRAAELAMPGVMSTWETRLRICWLLDAGLPEPLVNVPIFDRSESFLGIADLFEPESGLVAEFDGDQHRQAEQHRLDNIREEKLEAANLVVVRSDKTDIRRVRRQLVGRLQDGYRRGRSRNREQDNWTLQQPDWWLRRQTSVKV